MSQTADAEAEAAPREMVGDDAAPASAADAAAPASPGPRVVPRTPSLVLVVDPDPVSRRFAEIALGRKGDLAVVTATDGAGAAEILAATRVQLVVAETELADANGLQLLRRLGQEGRLRGVPFIFLSADGRPATRTAAFAAGADDYLIKPCDGDLLTTRARALVAREQRARAERQASSFGLAGRFTELACLDLLSLLEHGQRSGCVSVLCDDAVGSLFLDAGNVVHAVFGSLVGSPALADIVSRTEGQFEFAPEPCAIPGERRTILPASAHTVDPRNVTARYFTYSNDEATGLGGVPSGAIALPASDTQRTVTPALLPAYVPDAGAAAQLEQALSDGFALGDLMSFDATEMEEWTAAETVRERFLILVAADPSQGVSSMLSLAGSPTEEWVLRGLRRKTAALGLSFVLRRARALDVVLIDIREPACLRDSFRRVPSAIIVSPPGGDPKSMGVRARIDMIDLVARLAPPAVLVMGHPSLKKAFRRPGIETAIRCVPAPLGDPTADLRVAIVEAVRLCAGSTR